MLATYPAHRNLLHLTNLTKLDELSTRLSSCYVIYMLATYPAHRNLLHLTILTLGELTVMLATYPAHRNLLHLTNLTKLGELNKRLASC